MATEDLLDLDAQRADRRALTGTSVQVRFGGTTYDLPPELPIEVFAPFEDVNMDIALLLRASLDAFAAARAADAESTAIGLMVDILAANPDLPSELLSAVREAAQLLLGEECYAALVAWKPSLQDVSAIAKGLLGKYAVSPGEVSASSDSSEDAGLTSSSTSSAGTDSTPEASGPARRKRGSSAAAA